MSLTKIPRPYSIALLATWSGNPASFPSEAKYQARLSFLDTLACMLLGAREKQTIKAAAAMCATAGTGPAQAVTGGSGLSLSAAALINGTAIHALDFDDYEIPASTHPSAPIIAALFALTENHTVTLGELLEAYLVGYECIVRIGEGMSYEHYNIGWHATSTVGALGAAAASAHLLKLDETRFISAISLASSMAAGSKLQFGTDTKAVHAGLAARVGVDSALLAAAGISACPDFMEGAYGIFARYGTAASPRWSTPNSEAEANMIGILEHPVLRKPWPSCAYTHRSIDAALKITKNADFKAKNIGSVTVNIPEPFLRVSPFTDPQNSNEARFSVRYCVAIALHQSAVQPESFAQKVIMRPDVHEVLQKITLAPYDPGPDLVDMSPDAPDSVSVTLLDGTTLSETVAHVYGGSFKPMSEASLLDKFTNCGGSSALGDLLIKGSDDTVIRFTNLLDEARS